MVLSARGSERWPPGRPVNLFVAFQVGNPQGACWRAEAGGCRPCKSRNEKGSGETDLVLLLQQPAELISHWVEWPRSRLIAVDVINAGFGFLLALGRSPLCLLPGTA